MYVVQHEAANRNELNNTYIILYIVLYEEQQFYILYLFIFL